MNAGAAPGEAHQRPPTLGGEVPQSFQPGQGVSGLNVESLVQEHLSVQALIRGYQVLDSSYSKGLIFLTNFF